MATFRVVRPTKQIVYCELGTATERSSTATLQQLAAFTAERDALSKRLEELEQELSAAKGRRKR